MYSDQTVYWEPEYFVHVYLRTDGLCGCVTADAEYPPRWARYLSFSDLSRFNPHAVLLLELLFRSSESCWTTSAQPSPLGRAKREMNTSCGL